MGGAASGIISPLLRDKGTISGTEKAVPLWAPQRLFSGCFALLGIFREKIYRNGKRKKPPLQTCKAGLK
jgi:hypothetical protein